jgi:hypothetical protein
MPRKTAVLYAKRKHRLPTALVTKRYGIWTLSSHSRPPARPVVPAPDSPDTTIATSAWPRAMY